MKTNTKSKGFTIIEVVLVLAIAGLIFLMVFIALPALQRGQRDTQRKNDLGRLNTALNSYQSNNNGNLPDLSDATAVSSFINNYVAVNGDTFKDPSGEDYILSSNDAAEMPAFTENTPNIYASKKAICSGEHVTLGQASRKIAFRMRLEGSGVACVNN
ncbi:MAG: type II secretion system protein [Candidatus Saccharibacteria bacterium]